MISAVYKGSIYAKEAPKPKFNPVRGKAKKAKGLSKCGVSSKRVFQICKYHLGYASRTNTSIFVLLAECLAKFGMYPSQDQSVKSFAKSNIPFLDSKTPKTIIQPEKVYEPRKAKEVATGVASDEFLQSFEWRRLRMQALKLHGARCQCCGASPATGAVMNVDHIKPRKTHPELALSIDNLQVLCGECNHGKGNWDSTDWRN